MDELAEQKSMNLKELRLKEKSYNTLIVNRDTR